MKVSTLIDKFKDVYDKYGDMQVYAFGYKIKGPFVYQRGEDDNFVDFSRE